MPVNATARKFLTDLLKATDTFSEETAVRFNFDTITVEGTGTIAPIGTPVIWDNASGKFEVYVAQVIATVITTGGSPLKDGSVIGLLVGDAFGVGFNKADLDLTGDATATVLYRGDAAILNEGIEWGSVSAPNQALFLAQLEAQRITTISNATVVTPVYTS